MSPRGPARRCPLPSDRFFIDINFGLQPGTRTFSEISTPIIYDEPASVTTAHKVEGLKALLDLGGGIRFGGNLGAGATYVRFEGTDNGETTARVPHPVQFNQPRTAVFAAEELQHVESALHFFALWDLPLSERIGVAVFAGPSLVTVKQDVVTGIVLVRGGAAVCAGGDCQRRLRRADRHGVRHQPRRRRRVFPDASDRLRDDDSLRQRVGRPGAGRLRAPRPRCRRHPVRVRRAAAVPEIVIRVSGDGRSVSVREKADPTK